jgi:hypothetical protein
MFHNLLKHLQSIELDMLIVRCPWIAAAVKWPRKGHFYPAESGHFYLGITGVLRIISLMLSHYMCGLIMVESW